MPLLAALLGVVILFCGSGSARLYAQVDNPGPTNSQPRADTSAVDSTVERVKVEPATVRWRPGGFLRAPLQADTVMFWPGSVQRFDELDTLPNWAQSLGWPGKPHRLAPQGLESRHLPPAGVHQNFITGQHNAYIRSAEHLPQFDTRTPYVNFRFSQASGNTQLFTLNLAQNITPRLNVAAYYQRRTSDGVYDQMLTDHFSVGLTGNYRSRNKRWVAAWSLAHNQLNDELNGGTFQDGSVPFDQSFDGESEPVTLDDAEQLLRARSLNLRQRYNLQNDSLAPFSLWMNATLEDLNRSYQDSIQLPTANNTGPWRPYGALFTSQDTVYVSETVGGARVRLHAGLHKQWTLRRVEVDLQAGYRYQWGRLSDTLQGVRFHRHGPTAQAEINPRALGRFRLRLNGALDQTVLVGGGLSANPFDPGLELQAELAWLTRQRTLQLFDSTGVDPYSRNPRKRVAFQRTVRYRPLQVSLQGQVKRLPPPPLYALWHGLTLQAPTSADSIPGNETLLGAQAQLRLEGKTKVRNRWPFLPNRLTVTAFANRVLGRLYLDSNGQARQLGGADWQGWLGLTLSGRIRVSRLYLAGRITAQLPDSRGAEATGLDNSLPQFWGSGELFYEDQWFEQAMLVRFGLNVMGFTGHQALHFEPSTGQFYPRNNYQVPGYLNLDVYASARIRTFVVWVKFINALQGWPQVGYYTTPLYPMLGRSLAWGVSWTFYN